MKPWQKYLAEFIGTFVLVFVACGVAVLTGCKAYGGYALTAVAFGLVIVAMAYSIGNVSGCHINPAVSLAMLISKKMSAKDFVGYVVAQVLGAIVGAALLGVIFGFDPSKNGFGANGLYQGNILASLLIEIVLTCIFVLTILGVTSRKEFGGVAGLVIGGALILVHLIGIGLTGTSVNPARSLGPAIFAGGDALANVWVFIVGPLVGGALAAFLYKALDKNEKKKK